MRYFRLILCIAAVLLSFDITVAADEKSQSFENLLESYQSNHRVIIAALEEAKKNAAEITKLTVELDRLEQLMSKNMDKQEVYDKYKAEYDKISDSLMEKYGVGIMAVALYPDPSQLKKGKVTQSKLEAQIGGAISFYNETLNCFSGEKYATTKSCQWMLSQPCSSYGSDTGKDMYRYKLTEDLELDKIDVSVDDPTMTSPPDDKFKASDILLKDVYKFCRLATMRTSPMIPKVFTNELGFSYRIVEDSFVLPFEAAYKDVCIDKQPSKVKVARLKELRIRFPGDFHLKMYDDEFEKWKKACNKAAKEICKNTYTIKDKIILAYPTVGCVVREVTKEDVENDIKWMDTEADKLKHSTMLDTIDICQHAAQETFWLFQKPALGDNCKKEAKATKKKPGKNK